ncbi:hypothetical protein EGR_09817 [Echinococcus granulosus]|uniref:Uncharacterized protein n=1 Tax=Echinococcus granulosus TaxID=6210 RepID=W6UA20_ECHGR|nr:hypothetical protein EGR_09817 [Echinococcus granulosus]EUB55322.1 hypothetical protein EGR_09817 [Echinococcus granulosus]
MGSGKNIVEYMHFCTGGGGGGLNDGEGLMNTRFLAAITSILQNVWSSISKAEAGVVAVEADNLPLA